jgi:pimeloyl-ACP methyl ester carboxylesterase
MQSRMTARLVAIADGELEVRDWGAGEPVVFVQTALTADELLPMARAPALATGYRKVVYHRRGYAGSSPAAGVPSIAGEAADARALLDALEIERAHIVGVSFSSAIALQLAADAPECAHSLTVAEPPPVHGSHGSEFRAANERLLRIRRDHGVRAALEEFLTLLVGASWRDEVESDLPGAVAQIERDAATFFDTDIAALLDWQFGPAPAARIRCPVLYVGGSDSSAWFAEVHDVVLGWLPHAEDAVIQGAGHSLELTHPSETAEVLAAFLRRHAMPLSGAR